MKSAKVLLPILLIVLLISTMAMTFAWFSDRIDAVVDSSLKAGTYVMVKFSSDTTGENGLKNEPYNGQTAFDNQGNLISEGADIGYDAYYHTALKMQGNTDLIVNFDFLDIKIKVNELFFHLSATQTLNLVASNLDGYVLSDDLDLHIGKYSFDGQNNPVFEDKGKESVLVYTDDGTINGNVGYINLNSENARKIFTLSYSKILPSVVDGENVAGEPSFDDTDRVYNNFVGNDTGLHYVYANQSGAEVVPDINDPFIKGKDNPICIKIGYYNTQNAKPFLFSEDSFKSSVFLFNVVAYANEIAPQE